MADTEQMKKAAAEVLQNVEEVSFFFASNIKPLFGIVGTVTKVTRQGLGAEEDHALEKDFREIQKKLESISVQNKKVLEQIKMNEVDKILGMYEKRIEKQFAAFKTMYERLRKDPDSANDHMGDFKNAYEMLGDVVALNVYYDGLMNKDMVFGRPLFEVYLKGCNYDREVMEGRCIHLICLFAMGLMSLKAYIYVTEDDEDEIKKKWIPRIAEIKAEMERALRQCK
ncbi:hypothetical protein GJAV_G00250180 [Gymnothorax javanicus]|nr:hypothetical protein GJAV_G00250180 [Gymnothorax javanicus]